MTETAETRLIKARLRLLFKHPFFGQLALRMPLVDVTNDGWCPTAATDFRFIYYNTNFIDKLDQDELVFLVAHEIGHCIFEHFIRVEDRDKALWNMAGDYVINLMLKDNGIGRFPTSVPGLLDPKYKGYTTEEVYDDLINNNADLKDTLDMHIEMSDGSEDGDGDGENDGKGKAPKLKKSDSKKISDEIRQSILQAAAASSGDLPNEINRIINSLTESKMDWREHIRSTIESTFKSDFTWMRPNRKGWHMSAVLPGMTPGEQIDIAIGIDTSGSISQKTLTDFMSEVNGIMEQFDAYTIRIWQFDTKVYGYDVFTHEDGKDMRNYEIRGGGGTDFDANFNFMKENEIEPNQFIMFTDMMPWNSWGDENYCDTLFVAHGTKTIVAPYGKTIYYD
jgi:predicted metal-dependent peptidase